MHPSAGPLIPIGRDSPLLSCRLGASLRIALLPHRSMVIMSADKGLRAPGAGAREFPYPYSGDLAEAPAAGRCAVGGGGF